MINSYMINSHMIQFNHNRYSSIDTILDLVDVVHNIKLCKLWKMMKRNKTPVISDCKQWFKIRVSRLL